MRFEPCLKIDAHAHAILNRDLEYRTSIDISPEELLALYDRIGVERGVLQPIVSPEWITAPMTNGDTCAIARRWPDRFFWFFNLDPRTLQNLPDTDFSDMITFFRKLGAVGVGEVTANLYFDDPLVENLFSQLEAAGLPVTIHIGPTKGGCYGLVDEVGLPRMEKMLRRHPDLVVLGHSQPFWAEIDAGCTQETRGLYPTGKVREGRLAKLMREYGNLCCDMSANSCYNAMRRDPDYAYRFIEEFGDRMLYAVDACLPAVNTYMYDMARWLDESAEAGCISPKRYRAICRENAIRILKLPLPFEP